jgi:hypothetical protein
VSDSCRLCGAHLGARATICPGCFSATAEHPVGAQYHQGDDLVLRFGKSPSRNYPHIVTAIGDLPGYLREGAGDAVRHHFSAVFSNIEIVSEIWAIVGGWKSARLRGAGQFLGPKDLRYGPFMCFRQRLYSRDPDQHCCGDGSWRALANIWGCHQIGMSYQFRNPGEWTRMGRFDSLNRWQWDRARLSEVLTHRFHEVRSCPVANLQRALQVVDQLPDFLPGTGTDDWFPVKEWRDDQILGMEPSLEAARRVAPCAARQSWVHLTEMGTAPRGDEWWNED